MLFDSYLLLIHIELISCYVSFPDIPKIFQNINLVLGQLTLSTIEASIMSTTTGLVRGDVFDY